MQMHMALTHGASTTMSQSKCRRGPGSQTPDPVEDQVFYWWLFQLKLSLLRLGAAHLGWGHGGRAPLYRCPRLDWGIVLGAPEMLAWNVVNSGRHLGWLHHAWSVPMTALYSLNSWKRVGHAGGNCKAM